MDTDTDTVLIIDSLLSDFQEYVKEHEHTHTKSIAETSDNGNDAEYIIQSPRISIV
jgi:hypothetical protein